MNEIKLSNNLQQIELEIQWHKENAGKSIWEIGKRLNHVKENDLVHGQFGKWLEKIEFSHYVANQFMKVARELPNYGMSNNLGINALYLIASLPKEEREKEHTLDDGETKTVDEMTVRELQEVKRKNKELEQQLKDEKNKQPKEKIIERKVAPHDYPGLKSDNQQLSEALKEAQRKADALEQRNEFIEKEYNQLFEERKEVDEKSRKYDELTEGLQKLEGKMNETQKMAASHKKVMDTIYQGNELLDVLSGLIYATDIEILDGNELVRIELNKLIRRVEWWLNDINKKIDNATILEGEIVYD